MFLLNPSVISTHCHVEFLFFLLHPCSASRRLPRSSSTQHHQHNTINTSPSTQCHQHITKNTTPSTYNTINTTPQITIPTSPSTQHHQHTPSSTHHHPHNTIETEHLRLVLPGRCSTWSISGSFCVAGAALGAPQARFCLARAALGAPQARFAWQVQHLEHLHRGPRGSGEE